MVFKYIEEGRLYLIEAPDKTICRELPNPELGFVVLIPWEGGQKTVPSHGGLLVQYAREGRFGLVLHEERRLVAEGEEDEDAEEDED